MLRIYRARVPAGPPAELPTDTAPPSTGGVPANALVADDGEPIVTDDGQYIVVE